jgi:hypothetical protein
LERRLLERNKVSTTVYLSVPGGSFRRCQARNLSAMGVYIELESLGLPAGSVVNLVFAVSLDDTVRLHRRKAVVAHVRDDGAGLMMQGRARYARAEARQSQTDSR